MRENWVHGGCSDGIFDVFKGVIIAMAQTVAFQCSLTHEIQENKAFYIHAVVLLLHDSHDEHTGKCVIASARRVYTPLHTFLLLKMQRRFRTSTRWLKSLTVMHQQIWLAKHKCILTSVHTHSHADAAWQQKEKATQIQTNKQVRSRRNLTSSTSHQ